MFRLLNETVLRRVGIDLFGREDVASALLNLITEGKNIALIGPRAAGKTVLFLQAVLLALEITPFSRKDKRKRFLFYQFKGKIDELLALDEVEKGAVVHVLCEHDENLTSLCLIAEWAEKNGISVVVELLPSQWKQAQLMQLVCADKYTPFEVSEPSREELFEIVVEKTKRIAPGAEAEFTQELFDFFIECAHKCYPQLPEPAASLNFLNNVIAYRTEKQIIGEPEPLSREFLTKCASIYTGLPTFFFDKSKLPSGKEIESLLAGDVLGQNEAAKDIAQCIVKGLASGLFNKPIATFVFVGSEGSGKTAMAESIAKHIFGSARKFFLFDIAEFEPETIEENLFGSLLNTGLIGDALMMEPASVLCFDHTELANLKVLTRFAQMLKDGRVFCGGREFTLANSVVIFTLSLSSVEQAVKRIGNFFIKAVDAVIAFKQLTSTELRLLVHKLIDDASEREGLPERGLKLEVDESAISLIINRGLKEERSARGIPKAVEKDVFMPLSVGLSEGRFANGQRLKLVVSNGNLLFLPEKESEWKPSQTVELKIAHLSSELDVRLEIERAKERLPQMMKRLAKLEKICKQYTPVLKEINNKNWNEYKEPFNLLTFNNQRVKEANNELKNLFNTVDRAIESDNEFDLKDALRQILLFERKLNRLEVEIEYFDRWDFQDALLIIKPAEGNDLFWSDMLWRMYSAWAGRTGRAAELLYEPCERGETEPMLILRLRGAFSFGYLKWESGVHRLIQKNKSAIAKLSVFPYIASSWASAGKAIDFVRYSTLIALKARSPRLGRIRSLVRAYHPATGENIVLQNMLTINENKQIAREILGGVALWRRSKAATPSPVALMRLYNADTNSVLDQLSSTEITFERAMAGSIEALLTERIKMLSPKREPIKPPEAG